MLRVLQASPLVGVLHLIVWRIASWAVLHRSAFGRNTLLGLANALLRATGCPAPRQPQREEHKTTNDDQSEVSVTSQQIRTTVRCHSYCDTQTVQHTTVQHKSASPLSAPSCVAQSRPAALHAESRVQLSEGVPSTCRCPVNTAALLRSRHPEIPNRSDAGVISVAMQHTSTVLTCSRPNWTRPKPH